MTDVPKPKPPVTPLSASRSAFIPSSFTRQHVSKSRCTEPRVPPLEWIFYSGPSASVVQEIAKEIQSLQDAGAYSQNEFETDMGMVDAILDAAADGLLTVPSELKPITVDPELWELRLTIKGFEYRLYYAEPFTHPDHLVALLFHRKDMTGTDDEIKTRQTQVMGQAALRFKAGNKSSWQK